MTWSCGEIADIVVAALRARARNDDCEQVVYGFDTTTAVDAGEAYWLEIKTVAQSGTEGPFPRYASQLRRSVVDDVRKLLGDRGIYHAGLLLILFTANRDSASHDLAA